MSVQCLGRLVEPGSSHLDRENSDPEHGLMSNSRDLQSQANQIQQLEKRVRELEREVAERDSDLAVFRSDLKIANSKLELFMEQLRRELKVMAHLQKTLAPTEFPNVSGFEFSTKFVSGKLQGGDYFDIFEHEDKFRFGVMVAHSSGYSMSALLLSVLLKLTGQMEARRGTPPHQVLGTLVQEISPHMQEQDSAQVFYGVIDRRNFELTYCALGAVVALHRIYASNELRHLTANEEPITHQIRGELKSHTVALNPRDQLVLCTEGVCRTLHPSGEQFGEERLYQAVLATPRSGVHELRNEIFFRLEQFSEKREPQQDLTVVALEVKDRVIKLAR